MGLSKSKQSKLFRAGYFTKGLLYVLIGGFAMATVIGAGGGGTTGPKGVIDWIGTNPFGQILVGLTGLGLLAYAGWRWYTAVADTEKVGDDAEGVIKRVSWAVSGTSYGLLAFYTYKKLFEAGGSSGSTQKDMIATLLEQPFGQVLVGIVGAIVATVGCYQLYRGLTDKHMEGISGQRLSEEKEETFRQTGRVGLTARFVVFGIIAYFLFQAALTANAGKFRGVGEAIASLRGADFGSALVLIVGLGMFAYGSFMFVRARYEQV